MHLMMKYDAIMKNIKIHKLNVLFAMDGKSHFDEDSLDG